MKISDAVAVYIKLRDKKEKLKAAYDADVEDLNLKMSKIEGAIAKHFSATGETSTKTPAGTAYISKTIHPKVVDREAFLKHALAQEGSPMLESKANVSAVKEYLEEHEEPPPGVSVTTRQKVNFRRS